MLHLCLDSRTYNSSNEGHWWPGYDTSCRRATRSTRHLLEDACDKQTRIKQVDTLRKYVAGILLSLETMVCAVYKSTGVKQIECPIKIKTTHGGPTLNKYIKKKLFHLFALTMAYQPHYSCIIRTCI